MTDHGSAILLFGNRNDRDLDTYLRGQSRFGDPMAYLNRKGSQPISDEMYDDDHGDDDRPSGAFQIPRGIPQHSWMHRGSQVIVAPNRYNIRPGRFWDGVDRSNGFESEMFRAMNERRRKDQTATEWAMSGM